MKDKEEKISWPEVCMGCLAIIMLSVMLTCGFIAFMVLVDKGMIKFRWEKPCEATVAPSSP